MKRGDKAIVPNSFGKWQSGSPRSRTMEKPDEPSEAAEEESLSNCTCPRKARSDRRCPPFPASPLRPRDRDMLFGCVRSPASLGKHTNSIVSDENSF
ncbi:hypothetical protein R3I93_021775 [Phoxinus phoxinus]|uniref:Uncharacterized protein n=1 Tax=Phoxinus phoxinus TaxID=58324 RepID=A0AAN9C6I3_9TELE